MFSLTSIQCEICNEDVEFNYYIQHCEDCYIRQSMSMRQPHRVIQPNSTLIESYVGSMIVPLDIEVTHQSVHSTLNDNEVSGSTEHIGTKDINACYNVIGHDESTLCTICLDDNSDNVYVKTSCNHIFCKDCIHKWLSIRHKCPMCKFDFNK